jgi:hypothetical protein
VYDQEKEIEKIERMKTDLAEKRASLKAAVIAYAVSHSA